MNNSSTYKVINRTLETTNAHVELEHLEEIEEKWGDVSINYNAYAQYDEEEIKIPDLNLDDDTKLKMRHTHVFLPEDISEKLDDMNTYYKENNLNPWKYAFKSTEENTKENNIS